jgi:adenosylcobinamide kinase / adenosylcobinamide-phosphate guanylyltransferase
MGTVTLITGGARSGKSAHALALAQSAAPGARRFFIATAEALDDEMRERIAHHRARRPPELTTVEEPIALGSALAALDGRAGVVVVDCLTLWISNLMLAGRGDEAIIAEARALAGALAAARFESIAVTGEVGAGIVPENAAARRFRDLLGWTNQAVAQVAARVVLMVAGCPLRVK